MLLLIYRIYSSFQVIPIIALSLHLFKNYWIGKRKRDEANQDPCIYLGGLDKHMPGSFFSN